jgi:sec-independent protein translocase protein TatA
MIGGGEIIALAAIALLVFGGKKIPELMKGLGKGMRSYKKALNGVDEQDENTPSAPTAAPAHEDSSDK